MKLYRTIDQSNHVPAVLATMIDTLRACHDRNETVALYRGGGKPHFPVPAIRGWNDTTDPANSGGVAGDYAYIAEHSAFVDWSRGSIEVY